MAKAPLRSFTALAAGSEPCVEKPGKPGFSVLQI
jgi:hypothetical protein